MNDATPHRDFPGYLMLSTAQVVKAPTGLALLGARCQDCNRILYPVLTVCPHCRSQAFVGTAVPNLGTVYAYSRVHVAAPGVRVPYVVGYVDLDESLRIFGRIEVDYASLKVGCDVELVVAETGAPDHYVYAFQHGRRARAQGVA